MIVSSIFFLSGLTSLTSVTITSPKIVTSFQLYYLTKKFPNVSYVCI